MADEKTLDLEDVPVSVTDEVVDTGGAEKDQLRKFGEYKRGNAPLSALERKKRAEHWVPLRLEDIHDLQPVLEKPPKKG